MFNLLFVGAGGGLGAISRYIISGLVYRMLGTSAFPYGTLTVNVMGCFLIGFGGGLMESRQLFTPEARLFVFTGMLGGFTTFSTFGYESFNLARDGQMTGVLLNIGLHLLLGLAAVWAGNLLSRLV